MTFCVNEESSLVKCALNKEYPEAEFTNTFCGEEDILLSYNFDLRIVLANLIGKVNMLTITCLLKKDVKGY